MMAGPPNPSEARKYNLDSVRALYGKDPNRNAVHGSATQYDANRVNFDFLIFLSIFFVSKKLNFSVQEVDFFFNKKSFPTTAVLSDVTCGVIKPHAVISGDVSLHRCRLDLTLYRKSGSGRTSDHRCGMGDNRYGIDQIRAREYGRILRRLQRCSERVSRESNFIFEYFISIFSDF